MRPAGSYVMDRLELRRVILYPEPSTVNTTDVVILIGNFNVPAGLRAAEAMLSNKQVSGQILLLPIELWFYLSFFIFCCRS